MVAEENPTFTVSYTSPVDNSTEVELICKESVKAKATADCSGTYTTDPLEDAENGFVVDINCEIKLGALSGPGCRTKVNDAHGPDTSEEYNQYLEPPVCCGPEHLRSWDQLYLAHLEVTNPQLYNLLKATLPVNQPTTPALSMANSGTGVNTRPTSDETPDIRELRSMINELLSGQPEGNPITTPKPKTCAPRDWKCRVLKLNMLAPPRRSEIVSDLQADLCTPTSLCGTWKHLRKYVSGEFARKLTNGTFRPGAFASDENSMWSKQGALLWNEAQKLAKDNQALGPTYMNQLIYKANLDLLAETRNLRLELLDDSTMLFLYVIGLGIPGVLLTAVYMTLTCRTWYKTKKNTRLRKQLKRQEDEVILRAARPGQKVQVLSAEQSNLLRGGRLSQA